MTDDYVLTSENYYDAESDKRYMSIHQYLNFIGHMGVYGCEARAMAMLKGEWKEETTEAMLVGSYTDSFFEGTLDKFKEENPDIFTQKGELKTKFKLAEKMIARCLQDEYFMKFLQGEKQRIFTGYLFGCEWKCKLDSYIPGKAIVDLKTTANMHKAWRVKDYGYTGFPEYWAYTLQLAVYQKIVEINTGEHLPCYIAAVTKEEVPEIAIIEIDDYTLENSLNEIESNMPTVLALKDGETEPIRCECCNYCKSTKKLMKPINYRDLINEVD